MNKYAKRKGGPEGWVDIRSSLCLWLGERLDYMAKNCGTWPEGNNEVRWSHDLQVQANRLLNQGKLDEAGEATTVSTQMAKQALEWVAENLEDLWI